MISYLFTFLLLLFLFLLSVLPLHLAVKIFGGRTNIFKTFLVVLLTGVVFSIISVLFPFGTIIAFILILWLYTELFRLSWISALLVWILQFFFVALLFFLLVLLGLNVSILSLGFFNFM